jgi:LysR family transcriptional regulator, chromosome initiation inhibitor
MLDIQIEQLKTLEAVIDEGSFDAAARALRVTPSAVSQRMKALEQQVGRVLVQRSRPIRATESGQVLMKLARQFTRLESDAFEELGLDDTSGPTSIPLAINADSLATWILPALTQFADTHGALLDIHIEDQDHTTQLLRDGLVLAATTSVAEAVQGCTVQPLGAMRYRACASRAFAERWFGTEPIAHGFGAAPVVIFDRKDDLQSRYLRGFPGVAAPPRHFVPSSADFARAVHLGLGWGMLPELQAGGAIETGELVDLDPAHPLDLPLYLQQWNLDSPLLRGLSDTILIAAASALAPPTVRRSG